MSSSTVSVVVPFLDAAPYLREAIESVERQTHGRWELVLVDDGSTDGSSDVAREAAARDPGRVCYVEHPDHANRGKSTSRNLGLSLARGDYVVFLDADDLLLPHKLAHQAAILDGNERADAVYGRTWYSDDGMDGRAARERLSRLWVEPDRLHEPPELLVRFLEQPDAVPCLCALMARREVLLQLGGFDESIQQLYEDQVLISKLSLGCRLFADRTPGERYRQHTQSSSSRAEVERTYHRWRPHASRRAYLEWLRSYVAQQGHLARPGVDAAIRRTSRPYRHPAIYRVIAPISYAWKLTRDHAAMWARPEPSAESPTRNATARD